MVPYMAELEENDPSQTLIEEVSQLTQGMINMQGPSDRHLELVYEDNSLIGFNYCKVDHIGHKGYSKPEYGYIMEFNVKPEYRRYGYGRQIFAREEALLKAHGTKRMYLNTDLISGLAFWKAMGFVGTGEVQPHNNLEIFEKDVQ